ncbi:MAG: nuclear transport factor 2 family protein [Saprospiraceae bacterium]
MTIRILFVFIGIMLYLSAVGQNEEDLIRHSIQNYFNGTAYNYVDQIEAAFHSEAVLYLETAEGGIRKMTSAEYIALFKNNEPGKFGGRYSKILSIDIEGNLALVKAEILMPGRNRRYIDVFIMRKMAADQWKIVSKAANSSPIQKE